MDYASNLLSLVRELRCIAVVIEIESSSVSCKLIEVIVSEIIKAMLYFENRFGLVVQGFPELKSFPVGRFHRIFYRKLVTYLPHTNFVFKHIFSGNITLAKRTDLFRGLFTRF